LPLISVLADVGRLAAKRAVQSSVVVEVFPLEELVVEEFDVVDDDAVEQSIELFVVNAVTSFDFAVQSWRGRSDVDVLHASSSACARPRGDV